MIFKIRKAGILLLLIGLGGLLLVASSHNNGFRHFYRFQRLRAEAKSIQSDFEVLEAELVKSIRSYKSPLFYRELGLLYMDRAVAEDKFGDPALRDAFLDKAAAAVAENIRRNPVDAWAYFEMGKIWMLYNKPLLTYGDKARSYLRVALELYPAGDFLNLNGLYLFLIQWDSLAENEKSFIFRRIEHKFDEKPAFVGLLRRQWASNGGDPESLKAILLTDPRIWKRIAGEFK